MKVDTELLRAEIVAALAEVEAAEAALEDVLRDLRGGPRAEKVRVTEAVETAFDRLRKGRAALAKLRERLEAV